MYVCERNDFKSSNPQRTLTSCNFYIRYIPYVMFFGALELPLTSLAMKPVSFVSKKIPLTCHQGNQWKFDQFHIVEPPFN